MSVLMREEESEETEETSTQWASLFNFFKRTQTSQISPTLTRPAPFQSLVATREVYSAEVFYWGMSVDGVGHLSLQLSNGTYISHWPDDNKKTGSFVAAVLSKAIQMPTLSSDIDNEKRKPDEYVKLPDGLVNESAIRYWWRNYCRTSKYSLLYSNCAQTVKLALIVGSIKGPEFRGVDITPYHVCQWVKHCVSLYEGKDSHQQICTIL